MTRRRTYGRRRAIAALIILAALVGGMNRGCTAHADTLTDQGVSQWR